MPPDVTGEGSELTLHARTRERVGGTEPKGVMTETGGGGGGAN